MRFPSNRSTAYNNESRKCSDSGVQATLSDKRRSVCNEELGIAYFEAEVLTQTDYYPFGMMMLDRQWSAGAEGYRYGFNGMERDDETYGKGNALDFGARIYDIRLGRFISRDPLSAKFSSQSSYAAFNNSPFLFNDPTGKSGVVTVIPAQGEGRPKIKISTKITLYGGATEAQQTALLDELDRTYNGKGELIDPSSGKPFMSGGKPLMANNLKTATVDGVEYEIEFEFEINIDNSLSKENVLANTDFSQNYVRIVDDDATKASFYNTSGNSGVIRKGDIKRKSKTGAHEILHGYTGDNHPDNKAKIEGAPGLTIPEGHAGVDEQYKHPSCRYGGLCGQVRQFTDKNAQEVVDAIDWNEDKTGGTIGKTTNTYYNEEADPE